MIAKANRVFHVGRGRPWVNRGSLIMGWSGLRRAVAGALHDSKVLVTSALCLARVSRHVSGSTPRRRDCPPALNQLSERTRDAARLEGRLTLRPTGHGSCPCVLRFPKKRGSCPQSQNPALARRIA